MQIRLRHIHSSDEPAILDILTDSAIKMTYMLPDFECREDATPLFLHLMALSQEKERYVRCISLGEIPIGFLNDVEIRNDTIEVGYVIHPAYQGRGYMTGALSAAIDELFYLGYREIIAGAFDENIASIRVMVKSGMTKMDQTDKIHYRDEDHLCVYYHITKEG